MFPIHTFRNNANENNCNLTLYCRSRTDGNCVASSNQLDPKASPDSDLSTNGRPSKRYIVMNVIFGSLLTRLLVRFAYRSDAPAQNTQTELGAPVKDASITHVQGSVSNPSDTPPALPSSYKAAQIETQNTMAGKKDAKMQLLQDVLATQKGILETQKAMLKLLE